MQRTILIVAAGMAISIICAALISYGVFTQKHAMPSQDLALNDCPELFAKEVVIVIGENASRVEKESAEVIAANFEILTGNKPKIYISEKIESLKYAYNLIIVGTPKSNKVLEEVYKMTNATRVTDEYPGENRGILEILRNPWNEEKAMLLVEGSDEWGVKAGSEVLEQAKENESSVIVKWEDSEVNTIKFDFLPNPHGLNDSEAVKFALSEKIGKGWKKKYQIGSGYKLSSIPFDHKLIRIEPPDFCILLTTEKSYFLSREEFNDFLEIYGDEYLQTETDVLNAFSLYLKLYGLYDELLILPHYHNHRWALFLEERYDRNFTDLANMNIQKQDECCWRLECHTVSQSPTYIHTIPSPIDVVITRYVADVGFKGSINILKVEREKYEELIPGGPR